MAISGIVFACVFGGALLGNFLRTVLPEHHLTADSKDVVKLGMGLIATMAALVLGLLIASAKGSYDTQRNALTQVSANIVLLDRVLAHYGAETQEARAMLHRAVFRVIDQLWPEHNSRAAELDPTADGGEALYEEIQALSPQNEAQRSLQAKALGITMDTVQTRWLMFEQEGSSIPALFLSVLVFWLTIIFISFGLFAPPNTTVSATLFLCALSVKCVAMLVMHFGHPDPECTRMTRQLIGPRFVLRPQRRTTTAVRHSSHNDFTARCVSCCARRRAPIAGSSPRPSAFRGSSFECDLFDSGTGRAVRRPDPDLRNVDARSACASRPVSAMADLPLLGCRDCDMLQREAPIRLGDTTTSAIPISACRRAALTAVRQFDSAVAPGF